MERKTNKIKFEKPLLAVEELYHTNKKLEYMNEELCKSRKEINEIFINVSHDLRSPVEAIRNSIEFLLAIRVLDTDEVQLALQLMYRRIDFLEKQINNVFRLSFIDSFNNNLSHTYMMPNQM